VKRVLLFTTHPVSPPWDSADKQLAHAVARHVRNHRFLVFRRFGHQLPDIPGRTIPLVSRAGRPGLWERFQVAGLTLTLEPAVDLLHAVVSVGPTFRKLASFRRRLPARMRRPAIHTVPGVLDPDFIDGATPIGVTVTLSENAARLLESAGFSDVRVIPPGIPLDRWPQHPRPTGVPVVLFAGHYDEGGGAEQAVRGVAAAVRQGMPIRLVMAMRTRLYQDGARSARRLRTLAAREGVESEILGVVPDMRDLLTRASLVVFPARTLGGKAEVPLVVLEALATGRPVVVSDLPPFRALGGSVTRVPPDDPATLGETLRHVLEAPGRWEAASASGRGLVEREFSEVSMARRYEELYREVLEGGTDAG
jgi:glycosyltransferase involved in cell wall biosynthesis